MKNQMILFAIVMGVGCVGCERTLPEEPGAYDPETEAPPSALIVRADPGVAEDQKVISDEVKKRLADAAKEEAGPEPADEDEAATQPAGEGEAATKPAGEGEAATKPAGEGEAATKPAGEGEATTRPATGPATKGATSKPADW